MMINLAGMHAYTHDHHCETRNVFKYLSMNHASHNGTDNGRYNNKLLLMLLARNDDDFSTTLEFKGPNSHACWGFSYTLLFGDLLHIYDSFAAASFLRTSLVLYNTAQQLFYGHGLSGRHFLPFSAQEFVSCCKSNSF